MEQKENFIYLDNNIWNHHTLLVRLPRSFSSNVRINTNGCRFLSISLCFVNCQQWTMEDVCRTTSEYLWIKYIMFCYIATQFLFNLVTFCLLCKFQTKNCYCNNLSVKINIIEKVIKSVSHTEWTVIHSLQNNKSQMQDMDRRTWKLMALSNCK